MQRWRDTNPYLVLQPYMDERAWLLPGGPRLREPRPRPARRPTQGEILRFLASPSGRPLEEEVLRRLRPGVAAGARGAPGGLGPPEPPWHVAIWRQPGFSPKGPTTRLAGECARGAPTAARGCRHSVREVAFVVHPRRPEAGQAGGPGPGGPKAPRARGSPADGRKAPRAGGSPADGRRPRGPRPAVYWLRPGDDRGLAGRMVAAGPAASPERLAGPPAGCAAVGPNRSAGPPCPEPAGARGAIWTGTYFDRFLAPPPPQIVAEAARLAHDLVAPRPGRGSRPRDPRGQTPPPRGCIVLAHRGGLVVGSSYCPGRPPPTGSALTRQIREVVAAYDLASSLPALCIDLRAQCTALILVVGGRPDSPGAAGGGAR